MTGTVEVVLGFIMFIILVIGMILVASVVSTTNEINNVHHTKVIIPVYIGDNGAIVDSNLNTYSIISNPQYPSGKNYTLNKYKINNAIQNNKSVELTIQTICMPLSGCADAVSGVEYA